MLIFRIADSLYRNIVYFCNVLILFIIMKSRLFFKVERKIDTSSCISYRPLFVRQVVLGDGSSCFEAPSVEEVINVLKFLFPDHRVSVICD